MTSQRILSYVDFDQLTLSFTHIGNLLPLPISRVQRNLWLQVLHPYPLLCGHSLKLLLIFNINYKIGRVGQQLRYNIKRTAGTQLGNKLKAWRSHLESWEAGLVRTWLGVKARMQV